MGEVIFMESGEFRRCREISRMILDAEEFVRWAESELGRLAYELSTLKGESEFLEMEEDVLRQLELGEMVLVDPRHGMHLVP